MADSGLATSRWAPSTIHHGRRNQQTSTNGDIGSRPSDTSQRSMQRRQNTQLLAYNRLLKSLRRLKWKSSILLFSHQRALVGDTNNYISNVNFQITSDTGKANAAEIMFKADFFEYYALLERVIIYLLECFGMVINADHTTNFVPPAQQRDAEPNSGSIIGDSRAFYGYSHRFHANVLSALDLASNPLHPILGVGKVRQYLGVAKEFRNRWKEIELEHADDDDNINNIHKSYRQILIDLKLDEMLASLLLALDEAKSVAGQHLASAHGSAEVDMLGADNEDHLLDAMMIEDSMDWD